MSNTTPGPASTRWKGATSHEAPTTAAAPQSAWSTPTITASITVPLIAGSAGVDLVEETVSSA